jgi:uncharacterized protein involved in type VI secretion and phage assembly
VGRASTVIGVEGREWIHRPFEVDLVLGCFGEPLTHDEINAAIGSRAVLAIGDAERDRMHGITESIAHLDGPRSSMQVYVARLIPEVGLLTKNRRSTVYQDLTIPELVTSVLTTAGLAVGDDFEVRVRKTFTKREYIVQY